MIYFIYLHCFLYLFTPEESFVSYEQRIPGTAYSIVMVPVSGGSFLMGNDDPLHPEEGPVHEVTVSDFWIGKYEITWDQYEAFVYEKAGASTVISDDIRNKFGIDGISGATTPYEDMSFGMGKEAFPATNMTQYAALMFCKWLTAKTGIFYRLPTEAEWEYACRAGSRTDYFFGDKESGLPEYASYRKNSGVEYSEPGLKMPNPNGLYDILGNVAEWTMDQYSTDFYSGSSGNTDPWLKPVKLYPRVLRGGSWRDNAENCKCSSRKPSEPRWKRRDPQFPKSRWWHTNAPFVGFRIVRPKNVPDAEALRIFWLEPIDDYN